MRVACSYSSAPGTFQNQTWNPFLRRYLSVLLFASFRKVSPFTNLNQKPPKMIASHLVRSTCGTRHNQLDHSKRWDLSFRSLDTSVFADGHMSLHCAQLSRLGASIRLKSSLPS